MTQSKTYFLVFGAGRGGTTLLRNCLDSHPAVCCLNEAADDALRGKGGAWLSVLRRMAQVPVASRIASSLERQADQRRAGQMVGSEAGRYWAQAFYAEIHATLTARLETTAGNKITTESLAMIYRPPFSAADKPETDPFSQARGERLAYFCQEVFAAYRFVFIARDGRRVVQSKIMRAKLPLEEAAVRWLESARIHKAWAEVLEERLLTVTFEELVRQPETTLRRACTHLGVEYDAAMLAGAQRSYAGESHHGFEESRLDEPMPTAYDALLREGLAHFQYPV